MIQLSLCTISFRHQLVSLPELAAFARHHQLDGLELWGAHAKNLWEQPHLNAEWLREYGLHVSMLSDYLPMTGPLQAGRKKLQTLCSLAQQWQTGKIRTFAGQTSSAKTSGEQRHALVRRLRCYCLQAADQGRELLVETHPNTYADCTHSTLQLLEEVDHPALKLNFDVLHIWEAGEDPVTAWRQLAPHIRHLHLKNILGRKNLPVFEPANIYSAAGFRHGLVPLFSGSYDFGEFLQSLPAETVHSASLEWFGDRPKQVIAEDCRLINQLMDRNLNLRAASTA